MSKGMIDKLIIDRKILSFTTGCNVALNPDPLIMRDRDTGKWEMSLFQSLGRSGAAAAAVGLAFSKIVV